MNFGGRKARDGPNERTTTIATNNVVIHKVREDAVGVKIFNLILSLSSMSKLLFASVRISFFSVAKVEDFGGVRGKMGPGDVRQRYNMLTPVVLRAQQRCALAFSNFVLEKFHYTVL